MDREIHPDMGAPLRITDIQKKLLTAMTQPRIRVRASDMLRPCDRFPSTNASYNKWVDIRNWIILGEGCLFW